MQDLGANCTFKLYNYRIYAHSKSREKPPPIIKSPLSALKAGPHKGLFLNSHDGTFRHPLAVLARHTQTNRNVI